MPPSKPTVNASTAFTVADDHSDDAMPCEGLEGDAEGGEACGVCGFTLLAVVYMLELALSLGGI